MNRICIPTVVGGSMILVAMALLVVPAITFTPISTESLRMTGFLIILVWGFGVIGLFVFGYGGLVFCRQKREEKNGK